MKTCSTIRNLTHILSCPRCKSLELAITVETSMQLKQGACCSTYIIYTDGMRWDGDSIFICRNCGYEDMAKRFCLESKRGDGPTNDQRADWAGAALVSFAHECGGGLEDGEAIQDLISDLGHLCDRQELPFLDLVQNGLANWKLEQTTDDPMFIDSTHEVSIAITPIEKAINLARSGGRDA